MKQQFKNVCQRIITDRDGGQTKQDKHKYDTLDEAIEAAKEINLSGRNIRKAVAYKCKTCFKYHVGRNNTLITPKVINKIIRGRI